MTALRIRRLDDGAFEAWDRFVEASPTATFFHRAGWKRVIENSFGHPTHYLFAEQDGSIVGVLPLVQLKHPLLSNALVSNAFCVYGGPAASDAQSAEALERACLDLAGRLGVDRIEFRPLQPTGRPGWITRPGLYATFRKPIDATVERNMLAIPRKQRAMVRKGIKLGLKAEFDVTSERIFRVYAESVRNLGTPVFPKRYFAELKNEFGDACENLVVLFQDQPVSGVMSFYFRDEVLPYYGGGTAASRAVAANDFMYWEVMRRACERGYRLFDFGRSKHGTGSFEFKQHWGFEPQPLVYEYWLRHGHVVPEINPLNPKFSLPIAIWKRLPLSMANFLGPHIVRHLG